MYRMSSIGEEEVRRRREWSVPVFFIIPILLSNSCFIFLMSCSIFVCCHLFYKSYRLLNILYYFAPLAFIFIFLFILVSLFPVTFFLYSYVKWFNLYPDFVVYCILKQTHTSKQENVLYKLTQEIQIDKSAFSKCI